MKTLREGYLSVWASSISRKHHALLACELVKTPHKAVTVLPLLVVLATISLGAVGLVQPARAADVLISSQAAPQTGTFYRMQGPGPLPFNRFPDLPLYVVDWSNNIFLIDDRSVDYEALYSKLQSEAEGDESGGDPVPPPYDYPTNVLWIEILRVTNNLAYLTLHNTRSNYYYQLLSKLDLNEPEWALGEVVLNDIGTNQIYFAAVPAAGRTNQFFRGVEGSGALAIYHGQDAIEPQFRQ